MIDLLRSANDFPGLRDPGSDVGPIDRVEYLERRFSKDIGDSRLIPYLQLHEFEVMLLLDVERVSEVYPDRRGALRALAGRLRRFPTPEHVASQTPPSCRIRQVVPEYQKVVAGVSTIERIGLDVVRERCAHFRHWLEKLEGASA